MGTSSIHAADGIFSTFFPWQKQPLKKRKSTRKRGTYLQRTEYKELRKRVTGLRELEVSLYL